MMRQTKEKQNEKLRKKIGKAGAEASQGKVFDGNLVKKKKT